MWSSAFVSFASILRVAALLRTSICGESQCDSHNLRRGVSAHTHTLIMTRDDTDTDTDTVRRLPTHHIIIIIMQLDAITLTRSGRQKHNTPNYAICKEAPYSTVPYLQYTVYSAQYLPSRGCGPRHQTDLVRKSTLRNLVTLALGTDYSAPGPERVPVTWDLEPEHE